LLIFSLTAQKELFQAIALINQNICRLPLEFGSPAYNPQYRAPGKLNPPP
jgi:hypothetical protein